LRPWRQPSGGDTDALRPVGAGRLTHTTLRPASARTMVETGAHLVQERASCGTPPLAATEAASSRKGGGGCTCSEVLGVLGSAGGECRPHRTQAMGAPRPGRPGIGRRSNHLQPSKVTPTGSPSDEGAPDAGNADAWARPKAFPPRPPALPHPQVIPFAVEVPDRKTYPADGLKLPPEGGGRSGTACCGCRGPVLPASKRRGPGAAPRRTGE
jgi:hypothetical protein